MKSSAKPKILVLVGPTASGKSALAIRLALKFNGEIISADSRQVYRGMDIGTGKVTKREQKLVRHWLLDVASPSRQYTGAHFKRDAQTAIRDITHRGKLPIICGGTGFWIDALVYNQSLPEVKPNRRLRAKLSRLTSAQLFARLQKLDPARAVVIDRHNPRRLIRALEIVLSTGRPVPAQLNGSSMSRLILGIPVAPTSLRRRIERRLDDRMRHGMIAEVRKLHDGGVSWKRLESFGLEYRWVARFLQKQTTRADMRDGLLRDIIAYSKRQITWFKRNRNTHWVNATEQAVTLTKNFLR